jgi:RecA/RadA recombinase
LEEGNRQLIVHVADADADSQQKIVDALKPLGELQVVSFASISPRVREETRATRRHSGDALAHRDPDLYRYPLLH